MGLGIKYTYSEFRGGPYDGVRTDTTKATTKTILLTTYDKDGKPLHVYVYQRNASGHFVHTRICLPGDEENV